MIDIRKSISSAMVTAGAMVATAVPVLAGNSAIDPPSGFFTDFNELFNDILRIVLAIAALLVFFYLIWGGIEWITSGGDKGKTEKARDKITAAIIGLIILAAAWAIITIVIRFLGAGQNINDVINNATNAGDNTP